MKISQSRSTETSVFTQKRFRQLLWAVLLLTVPSVVNIYLGESEGRFYSIMAIMGAVAVLSFNFYLIKIDKEKLARILFLWAMALSIAYVAWLNGGLRDTSILSYPILIVYSALMSGFRVFLSILCFLILSILFLGANTIYGWFPYPPPPLGWEQVVDAELITLVAAYMAWTFTLDMNTTLTNLRAENDKVVKSSETIQLMVKRDSLTGLHNRLACEAHYQALQEVLNPENERIILFFLDLDNFKNINDSFGHNAGDELLIALSNELKKLLLPSDVAGRLSGDEFVLIIRRDALFNIDDFAGDVLKAITTPYYIYDTTIKMTGSVGIVVTPDDGKAFDEVHKKADIAVYKSKQSGKNTFSYYSTHLYEDTLRKIAILNGLKDALENNLLDLHIQPKVNLSTGKMESAEALLRWNRGNPSNFGPDEFIPVIESTEMIHGIGQWCIEEACRMCRRWHDAGYDGMSIAVNVSSVQFMRGNFNTLVFNALEESHLAPQFLEIELTEHVLVQYNETVTSQLKSLKDLGVQLSIDDFGTGYSNLSYLINFKVDMIKLDKSFISKLDVSPEHLVVVKAVIQMAQILNLKVVAEGVESEAVKQILIDLGCDYAQGFLWSKALPDSQFMKAVNGFNAQPF